MQLSSIKQTIEEILNLEERDFLNARLLSFTSQKYNGQNKHRSLEYTIINTNFPKNKVIENAKYLLSYFKNKKLKEDTLLLKYTPTNPKDSIDFIELINHDFNNPDIINGSEPSISSDSYKVEFLLSCLDKCNSDATSKSEFKSMKYNAFQIHTTNGKSIYIINKSSLLYNPRGLVFALNDVENDASYKKDSFQYTQLLGPLFKIPIVPHIIVIDGYCYFLSDNVESLFGFEQHNRIVSKTVLNKISQFFNIDQSSLDIISKKLEAAKNFNLFADFDEDRLNSVINKDVQAISTLQDKLKVGIDINLNLSFRTGEEAERFIHFITQRAYPISFEEEDSNNPSEYIYPRSYKKISLP
ncbi:hypothetical protein [Clostridium perfringens]|uniref:hypothetical protein n=1 Tax=Clostridium perfringens TaxID=1502 RepID=UPI0024BC0246|nr:hypothetical protein [Clostridium perfringens]